MATHKNFSKSPQKSKASYTLVVATMLIVLVLVVSSIGYFNAAMAQPEFAEPETEAVLLASSSEQDSTMINQQFDVQVSYAYAGPRKDHFTCQNPMQDKIPITTLNAVSLYPVMVYLNFTHVSNAEVESCDARMDVYLIELTADTGATEKYTYAEGTNYDPAFSDLDTLSSYISAFDEIYTTNGFSGGFTFNWTIGTSSLGGRVGSYGSYQSDDSGLGLWSAGEPNTINISIRRVGTISMNGKAAFTTNDVSSEKMLQVQLEKFGNGLIYNKIVSQQKLSQIDLFYPPIPES